MILKGRGENDFFSPHFNVWVFKYYSVGVLIPCSAQGQKLLTVCRNGVLSIVLQMLLLSYCHAVSVVWEDSSYDEIITSMS